MVLSRFGKRLRWDLIMPATESEHTLIRYKVKRDESQLSHEIIDLLFDEAEADYLGKSRRVVKQAALVEVLRGLVAEYRTDTSYKQNQTSENLSDIAKGYAEDLAKAEATLEDMLSSETSFGYMAATRKMPVSKRDMP